MSTLLALLAACGTANDAAPVEATPKADAQGRIRLSAAQVANLGLRSVPAQAATTAPLTGLPAEVTVPLASSAQVTMPYAGVVTRVLVDEGETVHRGQPMLRLQSRELIAVQADLMRAQAASALAMQQARRDVLLEKEGLIPAARVQASRAQAQAASASVQQAVASLAQLRPSGGAAGEFELLAPQAGRVLHRQVKPGQALEALAPAFTLAADDHLDLEFAVPVEQAKRLQVGQQVTLPGGAQATVAAVGGDADAGAQSLRVRAQLAAGSGLLPGQQLDVTLQLPVPAGAVTVPAGALLQDGDGHLLFVREGDAWHALKVRQLGGDGRNVVVLGTGLHVGMPVVTAGASLLNTMTAAE
ncbi:MAG: efflux RND transporter periplasmic adaptor subunit [Xanthomonadaceae bacterium]|nr:efflux RND transporter periplasmic adaptor subunit [Xanthomonadaceae bacterium]